jgi:hypothetical protein
MRAAVRADGRKMRSGRGERLGNYWCSRQHQRRCQPTISLGWHDRGHHYGTGSVQKHVGGGSSMHLSNTAARAPRRVARSRYEVGPGGKCPEIWRATSQFGGSPTGSTRRTCHARYAIAEPTLISSIPRLRKGKGRYPGKGAAKFDTRHHQPEYDEHARIGGSCVVRETAKKLAAAERGKRAAKNALMNSSRQR